MKLEFKLVFIATIMIQVLSGCSLINNNIEIETQDITIEAGQTLSYQQVINQAVLSIEADNRLGHQQSSQLKGYGNIDWSTPNSYNLTYQVCISKRICESKDFELNIVTDINSKQALEEIRSVYITTHNLDVPLNTRLSQGQIISAATSKIIDSEDGTFENSLSITGYESINWNKVGQYQISIGSCDTQLNCSESETTINIRDDIASLQIVQQAND